MNEKIFISIASYRDPMLSFTINDAVSKAHHPELLVFGVVNQQYDDQRIALASVIGTARLRYLHVDPHDTLGVSWARHLAYSLHDEETYLLQIDSHTLFEPGWDTQLKQQHIQMRELSAKPVITTYPEGFKMVDGAPEWSPLPPDHALIIRPVPQGLLSEENVCLTFIAYRVVANEPVPGCHIAGGFIFCSGKFMEEVPYDPYLYFWGDEQSLSVRAFTHGWDIYHPTTVPLYHLYRESGTNHSELHWNGEIDKQRQLDSVHLTKRSNTRLHRLLCGDGLPGAYGLGRVRSLDEFIALSGIDYKQKLIRDPYAGKYGALPTASEQMSPEMPVALDVAA